MRGQSSNSFAASATSVTDVWDTVGLIIAGLQLFFVIIVSLSLPVAAKRGGAAAGTIFIILAFATIIWITRSVLWQQ